MLVSLKLSLIANEPVVFFPGCARSDMSSETNIRERHSLLVLLLARNAARLASSVVAKRFCSTASRLGRDAWNLSMGKSVGGGAFSGVSKGEQGDVEAFTVLTGGGEASNTNNSAITHTMATMATIERTPTIEATLFKFGFYMLIMKAN